MSGVDPSITKALGMSNNNVAELGNILDKIIVKNQLKDFDEVKIYVAPYEVATLNVTQQ